MADTKWDSKWAKDPEKAPGVDEAAVLRKLNRHIVTKFFLMTVLCYIDRTNLAFAALQLNKSLGFTERVYGLGSGVFFVGYALFQVPSNMILVRVGAPRWLSFIVVSWGLCATLFAAMRTETEFYVLRFLLGLTECGTFPGMWYYMSLWYSEKDLGMAYSWISAGTALSQVFGAPLAAMLLSLDGLLGLRGYQWLFIVEGVPTIALGIYIHYSLHEGPASASFLTAEEREWCLARAKGGQAEHAKDLCGKHGYWGAVFQWQTYHVALIACLEGTVKNSLLYWTPLIIYSLVADFSKAAARQLAEVLLPPEAAEGGAAIVALLTALPFGLAAGWMLLLAKSSQMTGERRFHCFVPFLLAAGALLCMSQFLDSDPSAAFIALLGATVLWGPAGIIYSLPATFLQGPSAATGIALINSLANVGGLIGPAITGHLKHETGSYTMSVTFLAGVTIAAAFLVLAFPVHKRPEAVLPQSSSNTFLSAKLARLRESGTATEKADLIGSVHSSGKDAD